MPLRNLRGKWQYRFRVHGQSVIVGTGLEATERNRRKAEQLENSHRQAIEEGRWGHRPLTPRLFVDAVQEFNDWMPIEYSKASTRARVQTSMASAKCFFGKSVVSLIQPGDVERYKSWRLLGSTQAAAVKPVTVKHDLDNLSLFFQWAVKLNYCRLNPVEQVSRPSDADAIRQRVLTDAEEKTYFLHATGSLAAVGRLIILQGLRPDEVIGLAKADVDLQRGVVHVRRGKTKAATRTLRLTTESLKILAAQMATAGPWVFPSPRKPGAHITKLNGPHDRVCQRIGLEFVLYDLRHTFATRLAEAGVDGFAIAAILGHSSTRVLSRYIHPTQAHQDAAMTLFDQANESRRLRSADAIN